MSIDPKVKNMMVSRRRQKGETFESSSVQEPAQKFAKKGGKIWLGMIECQREAKYMGDKFVNEVG